MGFHSGLITAAQSESELAGVMAHEIAHVTQKHLARMISGNQYTGMIASIAALAIAILASRSNPQAGSAVMAATQAGLIQSQLNFTRKHEKEADRIGFDMLIKAGLIHMAWLHFLNACNMPAVIMKIARLHFSELIR